MRAQQADIDRPHQVFRIDRLLERRAAPHQRHPLCGSAQPQRPRRVIVHTQYHRNPQDQHRRLAAEQDLVGASARSEALVGRVRIRAQDAETHDALQLRAGGGLGERLAGALVGVHVAIAARLLQDAHQVDRVAATVDCAGERERVAIVDQLDLGLGVLGKLPQLFGGALGSHGGAQPPARGGRREFAQQQAPQVAVGARDEDAIRQVGHGDGS